MIPGIELGCNGRPANEPDMGRAFVRQRSERCAHVMAALEPTAKPLLPDVRIRILDGNKLAANPKHEILAVNALGAREQTNPSLAISTGDVFTRTFKNRGCIGEYR